MERHTSAKENTVKHEHASIPSRVPPAYVPNRHPLPLVSATTSTSSPSYGGARILETLLQPDEQQQTVHEMYKVSKARGRYMQDQVELIVAPQDILKHVSSAELERFEYENHKETMRQEDAERVARLAQRKRPGRPSKLKSPVRSEPARRDTTSAPPVKRPGRPPKMQTAPNTSVETSISQVDAQSRSHTSSTDPAARQKTTKSHSQSRTSRSTRSSQKESSASTPDVSRKRSFSTSSSNTKRRRIDSSISSHLQSDPAPNEDEIYEVERIVDDILVDGERIYSVKWVGFEELTEEPEPNLISAGEALDEYWSRTIGNAGKHDVERRPLSK